MENYNFYYPVLLCSFLLLCSCDERLEIDPPEMDKNKELLVGDWQFDFVIVSNDTFRHVDIIFEPTKDEEIDTPINLRYIRYMTDHSYEFRADLRVAALGYIINYQPNFGFWDLETSVDSLILIHNKLMDYEVRYEIQELNEARMVRKQIGGRINQNDTTGIHEEWIEVLSQKNN